MQYSIDTSAILDGRVRYYPPDVFPALWNKVDGIINSGILRASEEVLHELERVDDEAFKWAKDSPLLFLETDESVQQAVKDILANHEKLVDTRPNRSPADAFVIAVAKVHGLTVIAAEKPTNKQDRPNIPDVCRALNVPCITFLQLIRDQKWKFEK